VHGEKNGFHLVCVIYAFHDKMCLLLIYASVVNIRAFSFLLRLRGFIELCEGAITENGQTVRKQPRAAPCTMSSEKVVMGSLHKLSRHCLRFASSVTSIETI